MSDHIPSADMAATSSASSLGDELDAIILAKLRDRYPYMKIEAAINIAEQCRKNIEESIQVQEPVMVATKARSSFFSLSAELRNRVYELALVPQKEGDGGIDNSTAICVGIRIGIDDTGPYFDKCERCFNEWGKQSAVSKEPALLRTSRQVRQEALPVYYGVNKFVAWQDWWDLPDFDIAIHKDNAKLVKHLEVHFRKKWDRDLKDYSRKDCLKMMRSEYDGLAAEALRFIVYNRFTDARVEL